MRFLVIVVAILAGLKVWWQDHVYRTAMSQAIVLAYQQRAEQSCFKLTVPNAAPPAARQATAALNPWHAGDAPLITIGDEQTEVSLWDLDNPLWAVRYRHPHLHLTDGNGVDKACSYDLVAGVARGHGR